MRIPMRDGLRLFAMAWFPDGEGPFPAVINYDPYRSSDMRTLARGNVFEYLARHGYAVLHLSVRGTDGSEGTVADEYLPQEQADGYDAVVWAAGQPWCNGSVGMIGTSYAGFTCLQVAMHRPPHLKAVIPLYATDDRYTDDVHYTGGALQGICDLFTWATEMICLNALPPHESLGPERAEVWQKHLEGNEPYHFNWLAHQADGPYWRHASLRPGYDRIQAAVYMIGGWQDDYRNCAVRAFQHLSAPKKALIGPWGHVFPDWGEPGPAINFMPQAVRWFDHWLKGLDTGILAEPPFTIYVQAYDPPSRQRTHTSGYWRAEPTFPLPGADERTLHLNPGGALGAAPAGRSEARFAYRPTAGMANKSWSFETPPDDHRSEELHSLVFTSEALPDRLEIVGWPRVRLAFASTAPVVNIVCRLCDVAPDGPSALVTWGVLNATHRSSHTDPEALTPGQWYEIEVKLDATAWAFEPGHRLRLLISGADMLNIWPSPYAAENTIWLGQEGGSSLTLPTVPAGQAGAGPVFDAPALPLDRYLLRSLPGKFRLAREPLKERAWFEIEGGQRGEWPAEGLDYIHDYESSLEVSDRDPARASLTTEHAITVTRHGSSTRAETHGRFWSTVDTFHLAFDLEVTTDGVERARRRWMRSFPRRLV